MPTYLEVLENARKNMRSNLCRACAICNGAACGSTIPGPGAKGLGTVAKRNYQKWQEICVNMDTICENGPVDTSFDFFGRELALPVLAGPVGAVKMHYSDKYSETEYNDMLVSACAKAGIAACTGDGVDPGVMQAATRAIKANGGVGVPTIKPWNIDLVRAKLDLVREAGAVAVAMDIDAAGLPFLKGMTPPAGRKTTEELREIIADAKMPFIVKGVMTVRGASKAFEAGARGIIVSNHGGRVLDQCPSTAEVLPQIVRMAREGGSDRRMVLVDGGIRSGMEIFKALAIGADGVVIARPFVSMIYGAGEEGPGVLIAKLKAELEDVMAMCGARSLAEIAPDMVRLP